MKPYRGGIRHDYKDASRDLGGVNGRGWSWFVLGLALPVVTVSLLLVSERNESKIPTPQHPGIVAAATTTVLTAALEPVPLALPEPPPSTAAVQPESAAGVSATKDAATLGLFVERGDTLEVLFRRNGLSLADLAAMAGLADAGEHLRRLRPGDEIRVTHADGRILSLRRELNETDILAIDRDDAGFTAVTEKRSIDVHIVGTSGVIRTSLFEAGVAAGMSDAVTMNMAHMFQWDIDFIQDVRVGDSFTVVYEELWREGVKLRNGEIVAAEFVNQGRQYRAAQYALPEGGTDYFTPEGRSVRKAFIRAPVEFTRISSNFNPNRRHPVLNSIRAHRGVDYAAPTGTPVIAAGDGKVTFRGVNGGYGNAVILEHGGNITTVYGHLSRFGRQRIGNRVKQGDVIGYVGKSGLATGPHLHYEYRVGGVHKNPRTVSLPAASPVPAEHRDGFLASKAPLWRQLDLYQRAYLASTAD